MQSDKRTWQLFELSILEKVVEICEKYDIRYFLSSGTLLGAVRHKGFIPWDDDIDINMPIKDFKKFCKIAPKELEKVNCFFQTYKTDPECSLMWANVRANGTTSMPISSYNWNIHWGAHIDIFPLIGLYDNKLLRKIQFKLFDLNKTLLEKDYLKSGSCKEYTPSFKVRLMYKLPRKIRHLIVSVNNIFIDKNFDTSKNGSVKWCKLVDEYLSDLHKGYSYVEFEGRKFKASTNPDKELTMLYGDYMTPPPEEERQGHELILGDIICDLNKDYKYYQTELRKNKCMQ